MPKAASLFIYSLLVGPLFAVYAQQEINTSEFDTNTYLTTEVGPDLALAAAPPGNCVPAPEGLVSWWRGDNHTFDDWGPNEGPPPDFPPDPFSPPAVGYSIGK